MRSISLAVLTCVALLCNAHSQSNQGSAAEATVGPAKGWLVIDGGGMPAAAINRFVSLAGGPSANYVLIPTAMTPEEIQSKGFFEGKGRGLAHKWGIDPGHITMLNTHDRTVADSESFAQPLRNASGVIILGGRQWRLADAYLGTAVERAIKDLLARGGVVFGSSAGATIQGSYLVRGQPETPENPNGDNTIMMASGHEEGFGLLRNSAIDSHVIAWHREADLDDVIHLHPELLGIGIDEGAAIVVHGNEFEVIGNSRVIIHDGKRPFYYLSPGQKFDLATRTVDAGGL